MRVLLFLTLLLSLALSSACGGTAEPGTSDEPENAAVDLPKGSGVSGNSGSPDASPTAETEKEGTSGSDSLYTDLDSSKCKTLELNEDEAWSVQRCEGAFGFALLVTEGDIRQTITVVDPEGAKHELDLWTVVSGGFSSVGKKAEWRFRTVDGKKVPFALIVRYDVNEHPEAPEKVTSYLTVSKITPETVCVTDVIKPIPNANVEARKKAESAGEKPCRKQR